MSSLGLTSRPRLFAELEASWTEAAAAKRVDCIRAGCVRRVDDGSVFCTRCDPFMRGYTEIDPTETPDPAEVDAEEGDEADYAYAAQVASMTEP